MKFSFSGADVWTDGDLMFGVLGEALEPMIHLHVQLHHRIHGNLPVGEIIVHDHRKRNTQFLEEAIAVLDGGVGSAGGVKFQGGNSKMKSEKNLIILHGL